MKPHIVFSSLLGSVIVLSLFSLTQGAMSISLSDTAKALSLVNNATVSPAIEMIIKDVRLPRILLGLLVGSLLAVCGAVMQGLFRNPLADPGIIGVSAGAALGAALGMILFNEQSLFLSVPFMAFLGGGLTTLCVYRLGRIDGVASISMMLLAGVAIGAFAGGGLGIINYVADDETLRDLTLWSMGSMAGATWAGLGLGGGVFIILFWAFWREAETLNVLLLGEAEARHCGINVTEVKRRLIWLTAAGIGITVALAGMIGFIGLIVPHFIRILCGPNHKHLLPLSALGGAALLVIADLLARTIASPMDVPVGIITTLIGAPFFVLLLIRQKGKWS